MPQPYVHPYVQPHNMLQPFIGPHNMQQLYEDPPPAPSVPRTKPRAAKQSRDEEPIGEPCGKKLSEESPDEKLSEEPRDKTPPRRPYTLEGRVTAKPERRVASLTIKAEDRQPSEQPVLKQPVPEPIDTPLIDLAPKTPATKAQPAAKPNTPVVVGPKAANATRGPPRNTFF
jgi:hypothetical protein